MTMFNVQRNRDAWFVIRGFVYQVDMTILRWLQLQHDEVLELERGEDIDWIASVINADTPEPVRLLEQVKVRARSLTLRSEAAREALANFVEHREANPSIRLLFRYSTSAAIGLERPPLLSRSIPAIAMWQQIQSGLVEVDEQKTIATELHTSFLTMQCPKGLSEATWATFQTFLATTSNDQILDLIHNFEWSTSVPEPQEMAPRVQQILVDQGYAEDEEQAHAYYERLFLYIFKLLSQSGQKQLTVDALQQQLSLPYLSDHDRNLVARINSRLAEFENRLGEVEEQIAQQSQDVAEHGTKLQEQRAQVTALTLAQAQVQQFLHAQGFDATFTLSLAPPLLDVPSDLLVAHLSDREETVAEMIALLVHTNWLAISGGIGTGKTHLAALIAQSWDGRVFWLRLRDLPSKQASAYLDMAVGVILANPLHSWRHAYEAFVEQLDPSTLLILDDVPLMTSGDGLTERLVYLTQLSQTHTTRLMTTSHHLLPTAIQQTLQQPLLTTVEMPLFTLQETHDILSALGAPPNLLTNASVRLINTFTHGHPALITAYGLYQRNQGWSKGAEWFDNLVHGTYASVLHEDVVRRLLENVVDREARDLLYRLKLITGSFSLAEVRAVSEINPVIAYVIERLHTLRGLWIQGDTNGRLLVSPLVRTLADGNLTPQTERACHAALGDLRVQKSPLNPLDVLVIHQHYSAAEEWDKAGVFVLAMLLEMHMLEPPLEDHGFSHLYETRPLPTGMNLGLRIAIRSAQIAVRHKMGTSLAGLPEELDDLLAQASSHDTWAVLNAAIVAHDALQTYDFAQAIRYKALALRMWPQNGELLLPGGVRVPLDIPSDAQPQSFLWWSAPAITSVDHINAWLDVFEGLMGEERQIVLADDLADDMCVLMVNRLWLIEGDKPKAEQDWQKVLADIRGIASRAWQLNMEVLWAAAIRAEIITLGEYVHDIEAALAVAVTARNATSDNPSVQFLITSGIGLQYAYVNRHHDATVWLREAVSYEINEFATERLRVLLYLSRAVWEDTADSNLAVTFAQEAVMLAQSATDIPDIMQIKAIGELGLAHWFNADSLAAFICFDQVAEAIVLDEQVASDWQSLFVVFAHTLGQLRHAHHAETPTTGLDVVHRGIFIHSPDVAAQYNPANHDLIASLMAIYAEQVEQVDKAVSWAWRAMQQATESRRQQIIGGLGHILITDLVQHHRFSEAIELARDFGKAHIAAGQVADTQDGQATIDVDDTSVPNRMSNAEQQLAEWSSALFVMIPVVFQLATLSIDDPGQAEQEVDGTIAASRARADTAENQALWLRIADIVEEIFVQKIGATQLLRVGNDDQSDTLFRLLYLLGATMQRDISYEDAVVAQLMIMPYIQETFGYQSMIYRRIIVPFMSTYWRTMFNRSRFRFSTPNSVAEQLAAIDTIPFERRVQYILRTISDGLTIRLVPSLRRWLS